MAHRPSAPTTAGYTSASMTKKTSTRARTRLPTQVGGSPFVGSCMGPFRHEFCASCCHIFDLAGCCVACQVCRAVHHRMVKYSLAAGRPPDEVNLKHPNRCRPTWKATLTAGRYHNLTPTHPTPHTPTPTPCAHPPSHPRQPRPTSQLLHVPK